MIRIRRASRSDAVATVSESKLLASICEAAE